MDISQKINQLRRTEQNLLIDVLNKIGGKYEWPEENEDCDDDKIKPWVTLYMNDGVWWDVEVSYVRLAKTEDGEPCFINIKGEAYPMSDCVVIDQNIHFDGGEVTLGDFAEIATHIPA